MVLIGILSFISIALGIFVWRANAVELFVPKDRIDYSKDCNVAKYHGLFLIIFGALLPIVFYYGYVKEMNILISVLFFVFSIVSVLSLKVYVWYHYPKRDEYVQ